MYHVLPKKFPTICLIFTSVLLFILNYSSISNNPFYIGDSSIRLDNAKNIVWKIGPYAWLPFLQTHIWLFYKFGAPYWAFKLIPIFYSLIATLFLGLLIYRMLQQSLGGLLFSVFLNDGYFFKDCDMVIAPFKFVLGDPGLFNYDTFKLSRTFYTIYLRDGSQLKK